jgi:hypothetical protein
LQPGCAASTAFRNARGAGDLAQSDAGSEGRERLQPQQKPLLPFLERLTHELPQRWDNRLKKYVPNDDWLLWELEEPKRGETIRDLHESDQK